MDAEFRHPGDDGLNIAKIAYAHAFNANQNLGARPHIPKSFKPASKLSGLADFNHDRVYPYGYI